MDANALVGSVLSPSIGDHAPVVENDSGQHLRTTMDRAGICLTNTFVQCVGEGPAETWVSTSGRGHRLDYIGIPAAWMQCNPR
eukprot:10219430-Alexandrium_andersonii.AAC.1